VATARVLGTCARECIANWRIGEQHQHCDKNGEKAVTRPQPPYFLELRSDLPTLRLGESTSTPHGQNSRNSLTASRDKAGPMAHISPPLEPAVLNTIATGVMDDVTWSAGLGLREPCPNPGHLRDPRLYPLCPQADCQGTGRKLNKPRLATHEDEGRLIGW
jgi:hypothetical protein